MRTFQVYGVSMRISGFKLFAHLLQNAYITEPPKPYYMIRSIGNIFQ